MVDVRRFQVRGSYCFCCSCCLAPRNDFYPILFSASLVGPRYIVAVQYPGFRLRFAVRRVSVVTVVGLRSFRFALRGYFGFCCFCCYFRYCGYYCSALINAITLAVEATFVFQSKLIRDRFPVRANSNLGRRHRDYHRVSFPLAMELRPFRPTTLATWEHNSSFDIQRSKFFKASKPNSRN